MGIRYDFYENPAQKKDTKQPKLHARVVSSGTMTTDEIALRIHGNSTLTTGDVKAVLTSLSELIVSELSFGRRVHVEGLGYFHLTLSCPPVKSPKEIRAESIRVKSIAFRPEIELKKNFKRLPFQRVREKRHSCRYSEIEIDGLLTGHFMDNLYITRRQFQGLCGMTTTTAFRRIKQLIADGKLQRSHAHRSLYEPVKGNYRR